MSEDAGEQWALTFEVLPGDTPGAVRVRRLLKYALRSLGLKCVRLAEPDEVIRLRTIIAGLTARVAGQSNSDAKQERDGR